MRIVVVGGVAGGMSCAARARRLAEDAEIIVLERGELVSFANCGLPYHVSDEIRDRAALLLQTPESLRAALNLDVRTRHEATAIDRGAKTVTIRSAAGETTLGYDALVLAPGARAIRPPLPGLDLPIVHPLRTVPDADRIRAMVADGARRAVVLGAGFIGLEAAEALRARGLDVTIVELAAHVLPPLDEELASLVDAELAAHGVHRRIGIAASAVEQSPGPEHAVDVVLSDGSRLPADLVVLSVGVRPDTSLAKDAGLDLGPTGAIRVDGSFRTSDPRIWAVGDAIEVTHAITGAIGPIPLAGPANRQGRMAAESILGRTVTPAPVLGTAVVRVFGLTAAITGAGQSALDAAGIEHFTVHLHPGHHAEYFPGAEQIHLTASFSPDGRLLGAQGVGKAGVDKRIDVFATALRAGMTADDLAELELAYAPPFGSAKDPINMTGFIAQNVLAGTLELWYPSDLEDAMNDALILDVRSRGEFVRGHLKGALNIPHTELRGRIQEVGAAADGRPVRVHCESGFRSYLAHRVLSQAGFDSANLSGGIMTLLAARPELELVTG